MILRALEILGAISIYGVAIVVVAFVITLLIAMYQALNKK